MERIEPRPIHQFSVSTQEEQQIIEITNDGGFKNMLQKITLQVFWIKVMAEYPEITVIALKRFSAMTVTKTKRRNKLHVSNALRVSLSPNTFRWNRLVANVQAQDSQ